MTTNVQNDSWTKIDFPEIYSSSNPQVFRGFELTDLPVRSDMFGDRMRRVNDTAAHVFYNVESNARQAALGLGTWNNEFGPALNTLPGRFGWLGKGLSLVTNITGGMATLAARAAGCATPRFNETTVQESSLKR